MNYITLFISGANLLLGIVVLSNNTKAWLNRWFALFAVAVSVWGLANYLFAQYFQTLFLLKSEYATGGMVLILAVPWITILVERRFGLASKVFLLVLFLFMTLIPYVDGLIVNNFSTRGNLSFSSGPLFYPYSMIILTLAIIIIVILYKGLKSTTSQKASQIRLVLIGVAIFVAASLVVNVLLPVLNIKPVVPFDVQSSIFWVALTTYAITRRGLFNVKVIATELFVLSLIAVILLRVATSKGLSDFIFESFVLVMSAVVGFFLIGSVRGEVARREEIEKLAKERSAALEEVELRNKNLAALQKISDIVLTQSEMTPMVQSILDELPHQLEDCFAALLNVVQDGHLVAYSYSKNNFSEKIEGLVGKDLSKYKYPLRAGFNLLHDSLLQKKKIGSEHLSDFISPPLPKPVAGTLQRLTGIKYCEALPLHVNNEPFGVLLLTFNAPKEQIQAHNLEIADSIADEVSIALQRTDTLQKLKDANEYLTQIDKMKDEFLSMASHELNTPLAAIEGYISMILDEHMGKVDAKSREYLNRAYESSKRLAALVIDLLNVSRIEQGRLKMKFVETNLVELSQSVVNELQIKADAKKIYLKVAGDKKKIPLTWCDPDRIREVIVNLAGNAIKFTEKGGITITVSSANDYINIAVSDTGRGISEEGQKKLFQKFSQVNRAQDEHQGTGLGLYISKNFVELHNGKLTVQSQEGKGATFTVELPIMKKPPKEIKGAVLENTDSGLQIAPVGVPSPAPVTPPASTHSVAQTSAKK